MSRQSYSRICIRICIDYSTTCIVRLGDIHHCLKSKPKRKKKHSKERLRICIDVKMIACTDQSTKKPAQIKYASCYYAILFLLWIHFSATNTHFVYHMIFGTCSHRKDGPQLHQIHWRTRKPYHLHQRPLFVFNRQWNLQNCSIFMLIIIFHRNKLYGSKLWI